jgi:hypothetical protein
MRFTFGLAALAALGIAFPGGAVAVTSFSAHMVGERAVPPTNSDGGGDALFVLDDLNEFTYFIQLVGTFSGPATGCRVCGPAAAGETAPVLYSIPPGSYMEGSIGTLTDEEITQLKAGLWYCNLETQAYPSGEIRCQIRDVVGVVPGNWGAIKQLYR